ncbi:MAG: hypothetical protein ABW127_13695 [Candidatus Thiodiazotropha endolucinida]
MDRVHAWIDDPLIQSLILIAILVSGSITGYYAHNQDQKLCGRGYLRYFFGSVFSGIGAIFIADSLDWPSKMDFVLYAYGCYMGPHMARQFETVMSDLITKVRANNK